MFRTAWRRRLGRSGTATRWPAFPRLRLEELEGRLAPASHLFPVAGAIGQPVAVHFAWTQRDARFNNELAVYVAEDGAGRVEGLLPSDPGYAFAVYRQAQVVFASGQGAGAQRDLAFPAGQQ